MRLLLINPKFPESFWSFSWALDKITRKKKAVNSPLGLATLAALTPSHWEITIVDENVEAIDWSAPADIVGVCGMGVQVPRQQEILKHFRNRGLYVVAGGSYASLCPEEYTGLVDTVVAGEAESIWPKFCRDFEAGRPQPLYRETGEVDLTFSPVPRYDLLKTDLYQKVSLQFSRGCPFRCEFCDIIVMFGRKPRTKTMEQVERELDLLRGRGVTSVFFVDDNLIGHIPKAKEFLTFLADYQRRHGYRFTFGTEASINMAADPELLSLFRQANFEWVFIGIETPNEEGLKETLKNQNLRGDLLTGVRTIYAHGIDIFAGFIVGFDADDRTIFDRQFDFIVASGITVSMVALLNALPKTPLYERLEKAGRLRTIPVRGEQVISDNTRPSTNIVPLQMSYEELITGFETLHQRLTEDRFISQRIRSKLRFLKNPSSSPQYSLRQKLAYGLRLFAHGLLPGGLSRLFQFLRSAVPTLKNPKVMAVVVTDWIAALALKNFRMRHFEKTPSGVEVALQRLQERILRTVRNLEGVSLRISGWQGAERLWIDLKGSLDLKRIRRLSSAIRRTLRKTHEGIVIDCRTLKDSSALQLQILLKKLRGYRHQVYLQIPEALYQHLRDELVPFHYTLVAAT